ncbi:hypothetical protein JW711_04495 [Candidatus Woesearchaeota archaeon]|nr:hypothetical protein [Candidatus Woesearchaeota archaeon]
MGGRVIRVFGRSTSNGVSVELRKPYEISYPGKVWSSLSANTRQWLVDTLTYLRFSGYACIPKNQNWQFSTNRPLGQKEFDANVEQCLYAIAFSEKQDFRELIRNFRSAQFKFRSDNETGPDEKKDFEEGGVLAISLGKDSLLTYGVMKELGMKRSLVFVKDCEEEEDFEVLHKKELLKAFEKDQGDRIHMMYDNLDGVTKVKSLNRLGFIDINGLNAMNSYLFMLMPFVYGSGLNNVIFGNEQNFNNHSLDKHGNILHPSYDQSSEHMRIQSRLMKRITGNVGVLSLVEPLYNIAEYKVLYGRYPSFGKYHVSCPHEVHKSRINRWCHGCPECAKGFLYMAAAGKDPRMAGFIRSMFNKKHMNHFTLFNPDNQHTYTRPAAVKEEQMFAFYLAHRNGYRGDLMDAFKAKFLKEAVAREDEFHKKFLSVHPSLTMPQKLFRQVKSIYDEELGKD